MTDWLESTLLTLLDTDTSVRAGTTELQPGDHRIAAAVREVVLPIIEQLAPDEVRVHPAGDLAVRFGPDRDDGLLLQTYVVSQHGNLMADPHRARIEPGEPHGMAGPVAVGQGANQNKGPMAAAFDALRSRGTLERPVWLTVNTEGRSSHGGSQRVIDDLGVRAAQGMLAFGTDLRVSLGNRGRVDVDIEVRGASSHSSQPALGRNPIPPAAAIVAAIGTLGTAPAHPELGPAIMTVYRFECEPIAPHTLPDRVRITVDRRLLPGEDPAEAVAAIARRLDGLWPDVDVSMGAVMLPAQVDAAAPVVLALLDTLGPEATMWSANTFDAGYACAAGIPSVMFGPGRRSFGAGLTAAEVVALADCRRASEAIGRAISRLC